MGTITVLGPGRLQGSGCSGSCIASGAWGLSPGSAWGVGEAPGGPGSRTMSHVDPEAIDVDDDSTGASSNRLAACSLR